jgi:hypothetical protein
VDLEFPFPRRVAHPHRAAVPPDDLLHRASFAYVGSGVTRGFDEEHVLLIPRNAQAVIDTCERCEPLANLEVAVGQREVLGLRWSQCQNLAECSHLLQFLNAIWDENMCRQRVGWKSRFVQDHHRSAGTGEWDRGGGTRAASPDNDYVDGFDGHSAIHVWRRRRIHIGHRSFRSSGESCGEEVRRGRAGARVSTRRSRPAPIERGHLR